MAWLFAALAAVGFVEAMARLPFPQSLAAYRSLVGKVAATVASKRISDHWKERALPRYAVRMLRTTLIIAACLVVTLAPAGALWVLARATGVAFPDLSTSWIGIAGMTAIAFVYLGVRRSLVR